MIPRYTRPTMAGLWSEKTRLQVMLWVEALAAKAMADDQTIPVDAAEAIMGVRSVDPDRVRQIEQDTRHDVIALLTAIAEQAGSAGRFLHQGMTSSDVLDTGLAVQLKVSLDLIVCGLDRLLGALRCQALEHQDTVCMGRSHGMHAEPTTFGLKLLAHHQALTRCRGRLLQSCKGIAVGAISGPVGTFSSVAPSVEASVTDALGLGADPISTQVIARDRHAGVVLAMALMATCVDHLATEIRHLQRSEVAEVAEPFGVNQKGSSAMPHKQNPVLCENLTGLCRLMRSTVGPALDNVVLWHERDIAHSSVERVHLPDLFTLADFALHRAAGVIEGLTVRKQRMSDNLKASLGLYACGSLLNLCTQAGIERDDAYRAIQRCAFLALDQQIPLQQILGDHLARDAVLTPLCAPKWQLHVARLFDLGYHLRRVGHIFERTLGTLPAHES